MIRSRLLERIGWATGGKEVMDQPGGRKSLATLHYEKGADLAASGFHADALAEYKEAIRAHYNFAEAHNESATAYRNLSQFQKAIKACETAIRLKPDYVEAYNNLGMTYDSAGEFLKAIKVYVKALRLKSDAIHIRNNLGVAYFNIGSYAEATKAYRQVLQMNPADVQAHHCLALVYIDLRDKDAALKQQQILKELGESELADKLMDLIQKEFLNPTAEDNRD